MTKFNTGHNPICPSRHPQLKKSRNDRKAKGVIVNVPPRSMPKMLKHTPKVMDRLVK